MDEYLASLPSREAFQYKRAYTDKNGKKFQKGSVKQKQIDDEVKRMTTLKYASDLFVKYQDVLKEMKRYDYNDMILWVLREFKNPDNELLISYQERYHYFLVDEYQDTSGAQKEVLQRHQLPDLTVDHRVSG